LKASIDALEKDANRVAVKELERLKSAIEKVGDDRRQPPVKSDSGE
jgi:hypothetical protein